MTVKLDGCLKKIIKNNYLKNLMISRMKAAIT